MPKGLKVNHCKVCAKFKHFGKKQENKVSKETIKMRFARELCKRNPNTASRTLARELVKLHPEIYQDIEDARRCVRKVFGAYGSSNPKDKV